MDKAILGYKDFKNHAFKEALTLIKKAKRILVWGDEDPDGMTATAILVRALNDTGNQTDYFVLSRKRDGFGLNVKQLKKILKKQFDLVITVDCGTSSIKEIEYLLKKKIKVIITDHHVPHKRIINNVPYINPHIINVKKFEDLSGAGVSLIFSAYLRKQLLRKKTYTDALLCDKKAIMLAGIGTVCDKVKITGFNKYIKKEFLLIKQYYPELGNLCNEKNELCGVFFQSKTEKNINPIVHILINNIESSENSKKKIEKMREQSKYEMVMFDNLYKKENRKINKKDKIIIHFNSDINHAILGLLASRLSKEEKKPVLIIGKKGEKYVGEARSAIRFDWIKLFKKVEKHFIAWGGHKRAAGFSLSKSNIDCFISDIRNHTKI